MDKLYRLKSAPINGFFESPEAWLQRGHLAEDFTLGKSKIGDEKHETKSGFPLSRGWSSLTERKFMRSSEGTVIPLLAGRPNQATRISNPYPSRAILMTSMNCLLFCRRYRPGVAPL